MKIRTGFVSNSSSSSFVIMSSKKKWEEAMKDLSVYEKAVINQITEMDVFFKEDVCMIGDLSVQDCSYLFDDFSLDTDNLSEAEVEEIEKDPLYEDNDVWEAYYAFESKLTEICDKNEIVHWSM